MRCHWYERLAALLAATVNFAVVPVIADAAVGAVLMTGGGTMLALATTETPCPACTVSG